MAAALDNRPTVDDEYLVGVPHRRKPVSDNDRGAPGEHFFERPLHGGLGLRVEVGGRFVEHDYIRRLQEQPGDGDALLFSPGQAVTPVPHKGVEAVG